MHRFTSLKTFKQQHSDVYTMSWVYAGITAYFSQQQQFYNLEFSPTADTIFCKDWNSRYQDSDPDSHKYFGLINEGHADYWFPLDKWKNVTLITGHEHVKQYSNNIKSIGFNRWDLMIQRTYSDPVLYGEVNQQGVAACEYDVLCLTGNPRDHRREFLTQANDRLAHLKIVTDTNQQILDTKFRTTELGFESYFNKIDIDQFKSYKSLPSFYEENNRFTLDWVPHQKMYSSCRVNAILETTVYEVEYPLMSEKTWKALAHGKPFVVLGDTNILSSLISKGFKTFNNFCDESYDTEVVLSKRISMVITALDQLVAACKTNASRIDAICKHNQTLFFNVSRTHADLAKFGKLCLDELYNV